VRRLWNEEAKWSQQTFGDDSIRGPIGPLKHLIAEAQEAMANPQDVTEFADCLMLVFDAARRAGFTYRQLKRAARRKLERNKRREWPPVGSAGDEPTFHIKEIG
jgi:hypothetical protein